jgi:hypothetical protein
MADIRPLPANYYASLDEAEADDLSERGPTRASSLQQLVVRDDTQIEHLPPVTWLADQVIPQGALAALYGPPGSGKSFVALDLALSIAAGAHGNLTWLGRNIAAGGALYLAAEGLGGLGQRVRAWKEARGLGGQTLGVGFVTSAVNLLEPSAAARIAKVVETSSAVASPVQLIVIDTLARSMIGDENDTGDMSRLIATIDTVRAATNATVLLVHHTRKDSELERGSSALRGGVDTLIFCQEGDDGRQLVCQKQKDAEAFAPIPFVLAAGHGSCVVTSTGVGSSAGLTGPGAHLTPQRLKALRTLAEHFTTRGATVTEWLKASDIAERTFYRVRTWLVSEGYVAENGARLTITASGRGAVAAAANPVTATTANQLPNLLPRPSAEFSLENSAGWQSRGQGKSNGSTNGSKPPLTLLEESEWDELQSEIDERIGLQEDQ